MTLGTMRELGVQLLLASCLNDPSAETEVPSFGRRAVYGKCGGKRIDMRPNWKEQPSGESLAGKQWRRSTLGPWEGCHRPRR